jgi:hypothetical protein
MSFSKTVSVFAALASIFAAGAAGWKLANENQTKPAEEVNKTYEQHITDLQKKISELENKATTPVTIPAPQPQPVILPPVAPPPPVPNQTPQE